MMNHYKSTLKLSLFVSTICTTLFAATPVIKIPDVSDAVKTAVPPKLDEMKEESPPKLDIVTPKEEEPFLLPEGETVYVEAIVIQEPTLGQESGLQALVSTYTHKALGMNEINELCSKISSYYREKGYMLARAYAPKQNVPAQNGVLNIAVVIGSYGNVDLHNSSSVSDAYLKRFLEHQFPSGSSITQDDLERTMLLIQRMPGAALPKIALAPGESFGASNLIVDVPEGKQVEGYLIGDNTGAEPSGQYRLMGGLSWNSPLGIGDQLSIGGMFSNSGAVKNGRVAYAFPLWYDGMRLELTYSRTTTDSIINEMPEGTQEILDASKGDASIYDAKLSYPLLLTQLETLDAYLDLSHTDKENRSDYDDAFGISDSVIPKKLNVARLGVQWVRFSLLNGQMLYHNLTGEFSAGNVDNNGPYSEEDKTEGGFSKLFLSYSGNLSFDKSSNFLLTLKLQKALGNKSLDGFEQLTLSGSNGVKVFTDSDLTADTGYFLGLEYQYGLPQFERLNHKLGIFAENARGVYEDKTFSESNGDEAQSLSDAGVVYYANMDQFFLNARWAHVLGGEKAGEGVQKNTYRSRLMLVMGMVF